MSVGNTLWVGRGDRVSIRGRLPLDAKLGRLLVFASERGAEFSPYALNTADMLVEDGRPALLTPLALRLTDARPMRELSFVSDIEGFIQVMQEVDDLDTPQVKVRLKRQINPNLGFLDRMARRLMSWRMTRPS